MSRPTFWCLRKAESAHKRAEWAHGEVDLETVICPANEGHQRPGKRLTSLSVTLPGHAIDDVVWTWYSECLLTDRALALFRAQEFTGFEVKPVKAVFERGSGRPPRLWEVVVTGWAGTASVESGIRLIEHCPACGHTVYSGLSAADMLIDTSKWDGSDFFIVWPLPRFMFVTDRVGQVIRDNSLTGVVLKRPEDLDDLDGFSPGRLSYWMPEKRAKELGEPLGIY